MDSNSSSYVDSDEEDRDSDVSDDFGDDDPFADNAHTAPSDIHKLSQSALSSHKPQTTRNCLPSHNSPDSDDGCQDGSSTGDSDVEDFLQLGASQSTTSVSFPNSFPRNTITQLGEASFPLMPSKSSNSNMATVGSLCGPRVFHSNMVKRTSSCSPMQPVLVPPVRSTLVGKRIAAGLGFQQNTIGISDGLAILPSEGGILLNSCVPSPLDNSENTSDGYDYSTSFNCFNIA